MVKLTNATCLGCGKRGDRRDMDEDQYCVKCAPPGAELLDEEPLVAVEEPVEEAHTHRWRTDGTCRCGEVRPPADPRPRARK